MGTSWSLDWIQHIHVTAFHEYSLRFATFMVYLLLIKRSYEQREYGENAVNDMD
jgi:hypothetical protein